MSKLFGKPLGRSPAAAQPIDKSAPVSKPPLDANGQLLEVGDRVIWGYLGTFVVLKVRDDGWLVLRGGKVHFDFPGQSIAFKKVERLPMLWSSYYPKQINKIPKVGDIVTYVNRFAPHTVTARTVQDGAVYLTIVSEDGHEAKERLEVLNWYPKEGDRCEVAMKPYLEWRKKYGDYALPDWTWKPSKLLAIKDDMASLMPSGMREPVVVPMECLIVVSDDGKTN